MKRLSPQKLLNIKHPIIIAPMFLVTNTNMMFAALNYKTDQKLINTILEGRRQTNLQISLT